MHHSDDHSTATERTGPREAAEEDSAPNPTSSIVMLIRPFEWWAWGDLDTCISVAGARMFTHCRFGSKTAGGDILQKPRQQYPAVHHGHLSPLINDLLGYYAPGFQSSHVLCIKPPSTLVKGDQRLVAHVLWSCTLSPACSVEVRSQSHEYNLQLHRRLSRIASLVGSQITGDELKGCPLHQSFALP